MTNGVANVSVVVATKGRPNEVGVLRDMLNRQTVKPQRFLVIGASLDDIALPPSPGSDFEVHVWKAASPGLTLQRNEAVRWLRERDLLGPDAIVIFFDDDFRPADNWIEMCLTVFADPALAGMTGRILADGIVGAAVGEDDAIDFLSGARPPQSHWASGERRQITSVYGCNMAFTGRVLQTYLFDESLPLYGWQEDRDMTGQAKKLGKVVYSPECAGVHLGANGGRTNGARLVIRRSPTLSIYGAKARLNGASPPASYLRRLRRMWSGLCTASATAIISAGSKAISSPFPTWPGGVVNLGGS